MKLFRYRSASLNTLAEIAEEKAWFSRYDRLSDPFEGAYVNLYGERAMDDLIRQFRVCCFSSHRDSLLLWTHYAENHRAVCFEYEVADDVFRGQFFPVRYRVTQPVLDKIERHPTGTLSIHMDREGAVFTTKSDDWKYEGEYRAIHFAKDPEGPARSMRCLVLYPPCILGCVRSPQ